jgi:ATP-dependent RNA helicase RhlE
VAETFVHRIGRTARAGASGEAIALCAPEEVPLLRAAERLMGLGGGAAGSASEPARKPQGSRPPRQQRPAPQTPRSEARTRAPQREAAPRGRKAAREELWDNHRDAEPARDAERPRAVKARPPAAGAQRASSQPRQRQDGHR